MQFPLQRIPRQIHYLLCLSLFLFSHAAVSGNWFGSVNLGGGVSRIGQTETLTLFTSSSPGITDTYEANGNNRSAGLLGIGGGYRFNSIQNLQFALGVSASYLAYSTVDGGIVHPLVNVAPDFDTLNYHYDVESYLFMVEPTLLFPCQFGWRPFISIGLGVALNRLFNYTESTPPGSTAGPSMFPFRDHTTTRFAYTPRIGIEHALSDHTLIQVGYQYIHAGDAALGTAANQETNQHITSGQLNTHLVAINLLFS